MTQGAPAPQSFAGGSERSGWLGSFLPKIQGLCAEFSVSLSTSVSENLFLATGEKWECDRVVLCLKFLHNFHSCYNSMFLLRFVNPVQNSLKNGFRQVTNSFRKA